MPNDLLAPAALSFHQLPEWLWWYGHMLALPHHSAAQSPPPFSSLLHFKIITDTKTAQPIQQTFQLKTVAGNCSIQSVDQQFYIFLVKQFNNCTEITISKQKLKPHNPCTVLIDIYSDREVLCGGWQKSKLKLQGQDCDCIRQRWRQKTQRWKLKDFLILFDRSVPIIFSFYLWNYKIQQKKFLKKDVSN